MTWDMRYRFDQIAINSKAKKKPVEEDRHHYIGLEHLDSGSLVVSRWGADVAPKGEKLLMKKGDVLFGKRRAYQKKVAIAPFDGIFSAHGMVLRPNEDVIDKDFFPMFISSDYFLDTAIGLSVGSLSPTINWKDLARQEFELPSMDKQRELAQVLWAMEETKVGYQHLLADTEELVKSRFVEMFGDPVTNPMGWPVKKLSDIAEYYNGLTYHPEDTADEGTLVLRSSNIQEGKLAYEDNVFVSCDIREKYFVRENDILMCSRNGSARLVGKVAVIKNIDSPMAFGAFMMIIRSKLWAYLYVYFQMEAFRRQIITGKTSTINQITGKMLDAVEIPVPSDFVVEQFMLFVQQADKSKLVIQETLEKHAALKAAIMRTYFN